MLQLECSIYADETKGSVNIKAVVQEAEKYDTGAAIYWQENGNKYIALPPFPITEEPILLGELNTSLLYEALERKYSMGPYAIGVFDHGKLVESKTGTGYIHKEHRKGGRSETRFTRRTKEQKKALLRRVSNRIEEKFKNYNLDYIFFGGNRLILKPLLKECRYLELRVPKISGGILDTRHANNETLNCSLAEITKALIFTF